jgi:methylenetetrahydrofolate reductase (NADPH)
VGRLSERLAAGQRVVTAELPIRDGADPHAVGEVVAKLASSVDAIGVTDNAGAHAHASSLAVASLVRRAGTEPIMNLAARDRNRLSLQSELLGAALHGIENVLCITGDDVTAGDEPETLRVFDVDSPQLLSIATTLQSGRFLSGRTIDPPPRFFLGAVENPGAPPFDYRAQRVAKKIRAGARFFLLQVQFDTKALERFMNDLASLRLSGEAFFLPSICILRSERQLRYMHDRVAGVSVPEQLLTDLERVEPAARPAWLLDYSTALAEAALALPGVSGLHLIPLGGPGLATELVSRLDIGETAAPASGAVRADLEEARRAGGRQ